MYAYWSDHAQQRNAEREGYKPPYEKIYKACALVEIGEEFHVRTTLHVFVCKRITEISSVIMTVTYNVGNKPRPTKQNIIADRRRRHQEKRSKKRAFYSDF
jgi:hypothetical protein